MKLIVLPATALRFPSSTILPNTCYTPFANHSTTLAPNGQTEHLDGPPDLQSSIYKVRIVTPDDPDALLLL